MKKSSLIIISIFVSLVIILAFQSGLIHNVGQIGAWNFSSDNTSDSMFVYDRAEPISQEFPFKVFVSAGHGGNNNTRGRRTPISDEEETIEEWYFNNEVASAFISHLEEKYKYVEIMRIDQEDVDVSLETRIEAANRWEADLYVSIHHNAYQSIWGEHGGVETWVSDESTELEFALANKVQTLAVEANELFDRGVKRSSELAELNKTNMTAVLLEGGFMDSEIDIVQMRVDSRSKNGGLNTEVLANVGINVANAVATIFDLEEIPA